MNSPLVIPDPQAQAAFSLCSYELARPHQSPWLMLSTMYINHYVNLAWEANGSMFSCKQDSYQWFVCYT